MRRRILLFAFVACLTACGQGSSAPQLGPELEAGRETFSKVCGNCHGGNGQGASAPALTTVLDTFGACDDQIRWITLGSDRHQEEVGPTYGDTDKEITAVMPSFETTLTATEIAQVAAFERHRFGGTTAEDALTDCGL